MDKVGILTQTVSHFQMSFYKTLSGHYDIHIITNTVTPYVDYKVIFCQNQKQSKSTVNFVDDMTVSIWYDTSTQNKHVSTYGNTPHNMYYMNILINPSYMNSFALRPAC